MSDRVGVRMVIGALAGIAIIATAAAGLLAYVNRPIPDLLSNLAVGALAGLAALLARTDGPHGPPPHS